MPPPAPAPSPSGWPPAGSYPGLTTDWTQGAFPPGWEHEGAAGSFAVVDQPLSRSGRALQLTVGPEASGPNSSSHLAAVYQYSGAVSYAEEGLETWYFAPGIILPETDFTTGDWNYVNAEWHTEYGTPGPNSCAMDVLTRYPVTDQPGIDPHWFFRVRGGAPGAITEKVFTGPDPVLPGRHDHLYHFRWSADPARALSEWYYGFRTSLSQPLSLTRMCSITGQANMVKGYGNSFGLYNYDLLVGFPTVIQYGEVAAGPSRSSVGA